MESNDECLVREQVAQYFRFCCDVLHTYRKIHTA